MRFDILAHSPLPITPTHPHTRCSSAQEVVAEAGPTEAAAAGLPHDATAAMMTARAWALHGGGGSGWVRRRRRLTVAPMAAASAMAAAAAASVAAVVALLVAMEDMAAAVAVVAGCMDIHRRAAAAAAAVVAVDHRTKAVATAEAAGRISACRSCRQGACSHGQRSLHAPAPCP